MFNPRLSKELCFEIDIDFEPNLSISHRDRSTMFTTRKFVELLVNNTSDILVAL